MKPNLPSIERLPRKSRILRCLRVMSNLPHRMIIVRVIYLFNLVYPRDPGRYARYKHEQTRNIRNCILRRSKNGRRPRTTLTREQDTFLRTVCSMYHRDHTISEIRDIVGDILSGSGDEYLKQLRTIFPNIVVPTGLLERMKDVYNYLYVRYKRPEFS